MVYWVVALSVLLILGGIVSVLPSRKERALGQLRLLARQHNLKVSIEFIKDVNAPKSEHVSAGGVRLNPKRRCASWSLHLAPKPDYGYPTWTLYESSRDDGPIPESYLVQEDNPNLNLNQEYWNEVEKLRDLSPPRLIALSCTPTSVKWLGAEVLERDQDEFISTMLAILKGLAHLNRSFATPKKE